MEKIEKEIQKHKNNLNQLTNKLSNNKNEALETIIQNDIKNEINFIDSLTEIKKSLLVNENKDTKIINKESQKENKKDREEQKKKNKYENLESQKNIICKKRNKSFNKNELINKEIKKPNIEDPLITKSFNYYFDESEINSTFNKKYKSKNFIYFECSKKRNGCKGIIKYDIKENTWIMRYKCDEKIAHDTITFDKFYNDFLNNNIKNYNIEYIKIQKFYIRALIKSNQSTDINSIKNIFRNKFNTNIKLSNIQINHEKTLALGKFNTL